MRFSYPDFFIKPFSALCPKSLSVITLLSIILPLSGCSHIKAADSPAPQYADFTLHVPDDLRLSDESRNIAEAMTLYADALISIKEDGNFSEQAANKLLKIIAKDPKAKLPIQLLLLCWNSKKAPYADSFHQHLYQVAHSKPHALILNQLAAYILKRLKKSKERTDLLLNVIDQAPDPVPETDVPFYTDFIALLAREYSQEQQFDKGEELFSHFDRQKHFSQNFKFCCEAIYFYQQAANHASDKKLLWLFTSDRERYQQRVSHFISMLPDATEKVNLKYLKHIIPILKKHNSLALIKKIYLNHLLSSPANYSTLLFLASLYQEMKQPQQAYRLLSRIEHKPKNIQNYYYALGSAALLAGQYKAAIKAFEWFLVFKPKDVHVIYQLAFCYYEQGSYRKAINKLNKLKKIPQCQYLAAMAYRNLEEYDKAIKAMLAAEKAAKASNSQSFLSKNFYLTFAYMCEKANDIDLAVKILETLHDKQSDDPEIKNFLGYVLADHNRQLPKAEKLIQAALTKRPDSPAFLDSMAWVYYRMKKFKQARKYIDLAIKAEKENLDPVIADHAGDIYYELGLKKKAVSFWQEALATYSQDLDYDKLEQKLKQATGN